MNPLASVDDAAATSGAAAVLDTQTVDTIIDSLLASEPPPHVFALADTGLSVALPPEVPVLVENAMNGPLLELCVAPDLHLVIEAWQAARIRRLGRAAIRLYQEPERILGLHFVDARHRFGVYLAILVGMTGSIDMRAPRSSLFRPSVCSLERDEYSIIRAADSATTAILGWTADELIGTRTLDLVHPDDRALAIAKWMEMLNRPGADQGALMRYQHRDGSYVWFEITTKNLLSDPAHKRVLSSLVDVTARMDAVQALQNSEQLLRYVTEALPLGIALIDADRRIVYHNERLLDIVQAPAADRLDDDLLHPAAEDRGILDTALTATLTHSRNTEIEVSIGDRGDSRRLHIAIRALPNQQFATNGAIVCITDVTERVRLNDELQRRATFDHLTGCHNRASILEELAVALDSFEGPESGMAVIFVDLNKFKEINDRCGHATGDSVLQQTGQRLRAAVRVGDVVGRIGGDEFLIVCPNVPTPATALDVAQRIAAALSERIPLGATSLMPGASVGVAWTNHRIDSDTIVATADSAMYAAKRSDAGPVLALA